MTPSLETERLILRPRRAEDAPALVPLLNHWDIARMLGRLPYPYTLADAQAWCSDEAAARYLRSFMILDRAAPGQPIIGNVGIFHRTEGAELELGYWLAMSHWGRGLVPEATRAAIDELFTSTDTQRLTSGHFVENSASGRVLAKLGFRHTGTSQFWSKVRARWVPHHDLVLERANWRASEETSTP